MEGHVYQLHFLWINSGPCSSYSCLVTQLAPKCDRLARVDAPFHAEYISEGDATVVSAPNAAANSRSILSFMPWKWSTQEATFQSYPFSMWHQIVQERRQGVVCVGAGSMMYLSLKKSGGVWHKILFSRFSYVYVHCVHRFHQNSPN